MERNYFRKKKETVGCISKNMVTLFSQSQTTIKEESGRPLFKKNKFQKKTALGEYLDKFSSQESRSRIATPDKANPIYIPTELGNDITHQNSPLGIVSYQGTMEDLSPSVPLYTVMKQVTKISKPLSKMEESKLKKAKHLRVGSNLFYNEKPDFLEPLSPNQEESVEDVGLSRRTSFDENYDLDHDINRAARERWGEFGDTLE